MNKSIDEIDFDNIYRDAVNYDELKDCYCNKSDVIELRLCEQNHFVLKPNQLYIFTVDENCEECRKVANETVH